MLATVALPKSWITYFANVCKGVNSYIGTETKQFAMTLKTADTRDIAVTRDIMFKAYRLMWTARRMAELYDERKEVAARYVHSTSRGHEAIQLAVAMQLEEYDYASLYYRDESMLLGLGLEPYELMLQLMAKRDDPFSGGRTYYGHPSLKRKGFPIIPHQSSATGMQAIPETIMYGFSC